MSNETLNTYEGFKNYWNVSRTGSPKSGNTLFTFLDKLVQSNRPLAFYVKKFDERGEEIHLFYSDSLIVISRSQSKINYRKHILDFEQIEFYHLYNDYTETSLTLKLKNGESHVYSVKEDTNDNWYQEYSTYIENLALIYL